MGKNYRIRLNMKLCDENNYYNGFSKSVFIGLFDIIVFFLWFWNGLCCGDIIILFGEYILKMWIFLFL